MSGRVVLPPDQYAASLPRKRMAAGALFRDEAGGVLLVDPVYKAVWDLPGGVVEAEESPHAACRREVREELGLDRAPGRILAVDWVPSRPKRPEGLLIGMTAACCRSWRSAGSSWRTGNWPGSRSSPPVRCRRESRRSWHGGSRRVWRR